MNQIRDARFRFVTASQGPQAQPLWVPAVARLLGLAHAASSRLVVSVEPNQKYAHTIAVGCGTHRCQSVLLLVSRGISVASKVIRRALLIWRAEALMQLIYTHTDTRQHQRAVSAAWRPRTVASFTCERQSYLPTPPAHRAHLASSYLPTPKSSRRGRVVTVKKNVTLVVRVLSLLCAVLGVFSGFFGGGMAAKRREAKRYTQRR